MSIRALIAAFLIICLPFASLARTAGSDEIGAKEHPNILREFGGAIGNKALSDYVQNLGLSLVALTTESQERWTFTVLDSPVVNAFALPGGYVYVTRGLLALANNEAELASVLGHEIGHIIAAHGEARIRRNNQAGIGVILGTILGGVLGGSEGAADAIELGSTIAGGILATHSKSEELEADATGIRLLADAGYDPFAAAAFLQQLSAKEALERRIAGQQYNPNVVDFFASHPATGQRKKIATDIASKRGENASKRLAEAPYLKQIDGMIYGDSAAQGFIRGQSFSHPQMRFTFTLPDGFILQNASTNVSATSKTGARFVLTGDLKWPHAMPSYITDRWLAQLRQEVQVNDLWDIRALKINGLAAATATADITTNEGKKVLQMIALRHGDSTIRLIGVTDRSDGKTRNALNTAMQSFRKLSPSEVAALKPYRIRILKVTNQSVSQLSAKMPLTGFQAEQFRVMNGYSGGQSPRSGDLVKVVE